METSICFCGLGHLASDGLSYSPHPMFRELLDTIRHILIHSNLGLGKQKGLVQARALPFQCIKEKLRELKYLEGAPWLHHSHNASLSLSLIMKLGDIQRKGRGATHLCMAPTPKQDLHPSPTESLAAGVYIIATTRVSQSSLPGDAIIKFKLVVE